MQGNTFKAEIVKQAIDLFVKEYMKEGYKIIEISAFTSLFGGENQVFVRADIINSDGFSKEVTKDYQF